MNAHIVMHSAVTQVLPLVLTMTATTGSAVVSGIIVNPDKIIIGASGTVEADETNNHDPIESYKWEIKRIYSDDCESLWMPVSTEKSFHYFTSLPYTVKLKLTTTYSDDGMGQMPPEPTVHTQDVVIPKADGVDIVDGTDVPVENFMAIGLWYQVKSGDDDCGDHLGGTAQERLTKIKNHLGQELPDWAGWGPITPAPTFRLIGGQIYDEHAVAGAQNLWNQIDVGDVIMSARQLLRIHWTDSCFGPHEQLLGSVDVIHRKVSATEWQIEATVNPNE